MKVIADWIEGLIGDDSAVADSSLDAWFQAIIDWGRDEVKIYVSTEAMITRLRMGRCLGEIDELVIRVGGKEFVTNEFGVFDEGWPKELPDYTSKMHHTIVRTALDKRKRASQERAAAEAGL